MTNVEYDDEKGLYYKTTQTGEAEPVKDTETGYVLLRTYDFTQEAGFAKDCTMSTQSDANPNGFSYASDDSKKSTRKLVFKLAQNTESTMMLDLKPKGNKNKQSIYYFPGLGINVDNAATINYSGNGSSTGVIFDLVYKVGDNVNPKDLDNLASVDDTHRYTTRKDNTLQVRDSYVLHTGVNIYAPVGDADTKVTVTFGDTKFATVCAPCALDFTDGEGISNIYAVTVDGTSAKLSEVRKGKIAANTGLVLEAAAVGDVAIPAASNLGAASVTTAMTGTNVKVAPTAAVGHSIYVLSTDSDGNNLGFYALPENGTVQAGKAYLEAATIPAGSRIALFFDSTTAVQSVAVSQQTADQVFNLQGQRLQQPVKGLNIVNGRKVIIK